MADLFISYSRRDKDFVETLYQALLRSKYDTWVDWKDIEPSTKWWNEIKAGIENSHTFVFVISPDSIESKYCINEAKHANLHRKRIIPILRKNCGNLPKFLTKIQWLSFEIEDDFKTSFNKLVETINIDLDHNKTHTWLELKAIEWLDQKRDRSLLLRKKALLNAEEWLSKAIKKKESKPTILHKKYIVSSRIWENIPRTFNLIFILSFIVSLIALAAIKLWLIRYVQGIFEITHSLSYASLLIVILTSFTTVFFVIFIILSLGLPYNFFSIFLCSLIPDFRRIFR